jgi:hypothetical protein
MAHDDDEMVDGYGQACLKAGQTNSGLCISASAESDWAAMQKWRKALKDRLAELRRKADAADTGRVLHPGPQGEVRQEPGSNS